MKFEVGDKVKVKENSKACGRRYAGKKGTVVEIWGSYRYPYEVEFDDGSMECFCAIELEKEVSEL